MEWVEGWGQRAGKVLSYPAMCPRQFVLPVWAPQGLQPGHDASIAELMPIATT